MCSCLSSLLHAKWIYISASFLQVLNVIFEVEFILFFYLFVQKKNEAEQSTPVLFDDLAEENLQFVSKLKVG